MAVEEHGEGKQLVRFRSKAALFPLGLILVLLFALPSIFAAVNQAWLVAALLCIIAVWLSSCVYQDCATTNAVCRQVLCGQEELYDLKGETEKDKEI